MQRLRQQAGDREFLIQGRTPEELKATMQQVVPNVRVEILPGGIGHWLQEQAPEAVNARLIDFLRHLDAD